MSNWDNGTAQMVGCRFVLWVPFKPPFFALKKNTNRQTEIKPEKQASKAKPSQASKKARAKRVG